MKADEAIQILKTWRITGDKAHEALDMAIDALQELKNSSEELKNSSDLIRRRDAIDAMKKLYDEDVEAYGCEIPETFDCDRAIEELNALPSAQPERKTGKWIRITQGAMPEKYICPFCHRTVESYDVEELLLIRYPYCHCGADMRGESYGD